MIYIYVYEIKQVWKMIMTKKKKSKNKDLKTPEERRFERESKALLRNVAKRKQQLKDRKELESKNEGSN